MSQAPEPTVILHIGGSKCGSSAIQAYLKKNATALTKNGVAVPGQELNFASPITGDQIWHFERAATAGSLQALSATLAQLLKEVRERKFNTLILSAENICNHPQLARVLAKSFADLKVRVVFYVRRQDDFLISSWQQWHLKRFASVEAFLADRVGVVGCWASMIEPWANAFGDDALVVRPFLRDRLTNGDVVDDFFDKVGLSQTGLRPLERTANPSFDEALARLAHRVRDVFEDQHDNRFYEVMVQLLGREAFKKHAASSLLDLETRRRILKRYELENDQLKSRYLPEMGDQPLFQMPTRGEVDVVSESAKLEQEIAMLTRCIFELAARMDKAA